MEHQTRLMPDGADPQRDGNRTTAATARQAWIRALGAVAPMRDPALTLAGMLDALAKTYGGRPALLGAEERFSYAELAARVDLVARWAAANCPGQTVGLLMPNRPALVVMWLGLTRAGCVAALLNPNLVGESLAHSVRAGSCALVIADDDLAAALPSDVPIALYTEWADGLAGGATHVLPPPPPQSATALLVYTSGTTGMPKAALVSHGRVLEWALWFGGMLDLGPDDRIYDCLPLYHSTGGVVAIGAALVRGASVQIAPGFRVSRFWDEVVTNGCTVFFYIGELCRYLTQSPPHPLERSHRLRLACGNGLHGSVWERFQTRFDVPGILEFYAATEGNVSLYNCEGKPGAIGRVPPYLRARFPMALIRIDDDGAVIRAADGRCVRCGADEPGEAIGPIDPDGAASRRFDGYTDVDATARKMVRDVFAPGDCWFRTGDLMRQDAAGFVSFIDRLGETFRWKGENVSTSEVASIIRQCPGIDDAVVYGVAVPGQEGRAGMAAITAGPTFDLATLWSHVTARLPHYARPLFVRRLPVLDVTGTFKLSTARLAQEGILAHADPVWFGRRDVEAYVPCNAAVLAAIEAGSIRP